MHNLQYAENRGKSAREAKISSNFLWEITLPCVWSLLTLTNVSKCTEGRFLSCIQQSQPLDCFWKQNRGRRGEPPVAVVQHYLLLSFPSPFVVCHHKYIAQSSNRRFHVVYRTLRPYSPNSPICSAVPSFCKEWATENMTQCSKPAVEVASSICSLAYSQESIPCTHCEFGTYRSIKQN